MSLIAEWLARHLFDALPEGVPVLDPEYDDADYSSSASVTGA